MQSAVNSSQPIGNFDQAGACHRRSASVQRGARRHPGVLFYHTHRRIFEVCCEQTSEDSQLRGVLNQGLLGGDTRNQYNQLGNADRGQIREFYLASLEQVSPELREKFFKLYAYYLRNLRLFLTSPLERRRIVRVCFDLN